MTASTWTTFLVIVCSLAFGVETDGNVGCLLSKQVCAEDEWCYDDFAFGHCMSSYKTISIDDLYRYELETDALKQLEHEFRRLFTAGYRWTHTYTQCIVKQMLHAFRRKADFDRKKCDESQDEDLERALKFLEAKDEIDPKDVALIKFKPSSIDAESEYGDELFIPSSDMYSHLLKPDDGVVGVVRPRQTTDTGTDHLQRKRLPNIPGNKLNLAAIDRKIKSNRRLTEDEFYELLDMISVATEDDEYPEIIPYPSDSIEMSKPDQKSTWSFAKRKGNYDNPSEEETIDNEFDENNDDDNEDVEKVYYVANSPKLDSTFIFDRPHRYDVKKPGPFFKVNNYIFQKAQQEEVTGDPSRETHIFEYHPMFEENDMSLATFRHLHRNNPLVDLTEEGMVHLTPESSDGKNNSNYVSDVLKRYNENGGLDDLDVIGNYDYPMKAEHFAVKDNGLSESQFDDIKERNRGEVGDSRILKDIIPRNSKVHGASESKQHHPMKDINDSFGRRHLKHSSIRYKQEPGADHAAVIVEKSPEHRNERHQTGMKSSVSETEKRIFSPSEFAPKMAHVAALSELNADVQPTTGNDFEIIDTSYTYIIVNKEFANLSEGKNYATKLEALLQLPPGTFSNIRQEGNQIIFKVNSNPNGMTASDVARKAESLKDELQKITDKSLKSSGIGNKFHVAVQELNSNSQVIVITFIVCGVIAGLVLGVGVLYLILHHSRSKQKLQDITQVDTEASQDYQELCRQRMAIKSTEKPEPIQVLAAQRIGGLSRESETSVHSPSSRSSTSSWNEEPISLNMDISTGHMVLSYMEDHLTNKDRLDKEWEALVKYDADQSVCNVAKESNNFKKNRYPNLLPYDHSRVILNEFCNSAGSDYINASTITDHDPRNAAYIATQGPLPHTSADFWQMIWEQGSVVIVMLTRLVENGVAMCHRYWPEEGSELYHIYEVHLVSEHIWCEDYLIRSFYLKNLKTGETRTVTQFHFLSWPDMGVPVSAKMILDFRRKVNKSYRGRSCPIVVHCSDGCGRTGTYCLIDMVLNRMAKGLKEIDIAATLEHIRDQRFGMVQTKDQFQFVLMAVAEEVHSILKTIP